MDCKSDNDEEDEDEEDTGRESVTCLAPSMRTLLRSLHTYTLRFTFTSVGNTALHNLFNTTWPFWMDEAGQIFICKVGVGFDDDVDGVGDDPAALNDRNVIMEPTLVLRDRKSW